MIETLRFIETFETVPYKNLALEELLLRRLKKGECVLYLWQNHQTVVIGRNQNPWRECRVEQLEADGGFLARRSSGGGAVFHDLGNLNFTFVAHDEDYDVDRQLSVVADALAGYGIPAERSGRNDVCVAGRKVSGNAFQHRDGKSVHHGTILVSADMGRLAGYLTVSPEKMASKGVASVKSRVANLVDFAPDITVEELRWRLKASFEKIYSRAAAVLAPEELDQKDLSEITARFASWEWRLGRPIPFTTQLSRRFPWGDILLQLRVEGGMIREAGAFSDALDSDFIAALPGALRGLRFRLEDILEAVAAIPTPHEESEAISRDIRAFLEEERKGKEDAP